MCCRMTIVLSAATNPKGEWIKALSSLSGETVFVCFVVEAKVSKILKRVVTLMLLEFVT